MSEEKAISKEAEPELRQLVVEARQGNSISYQRLLQRLAPLLRKYAAIQLGRFGRQNYAEDVTQEALLAIHLKLHTYDLDQPFLAWARAITYYKLIDCLRRMRQTTIFIEDLEFFEPEDTHNPEAAAINYDLQKLLGRLKPPSGEIIYALKVEGASITELAVKHRLSESNIKVLVHRGLQKLSALMREERPA